MVTLLLLVLACVQVTPPPPPPPLPPPPPNPDLALLAELDLPPEGRTLRLQHELSFSEPQAADEAVARLSALGLRVHTDAERGESWAVLAEEELLLTPERARERRAVMEGLSADLRGSYEGWSVQ